MAFKSPRIFIVMFFFQILSAQNFVFHPHKFGANLFAGGIDNPRFQFVDIDSDGDPDLFILDRDEQLSFYRNVNLQFLLEPTTNYGLSFGSWFHFADIDNDGDLDCLTNGSGSEVTVYTNIGSVSSPQFIVTNPALTDTSGTELYSERFSIPTFADIDGDGDLDFFSGSSLGSVSYYKNIGTPFLPEFAFITSAFGGINIQGGGKKTLKAMHGASGIEFFDADSNGVLDLFWGDYFNPSLYFLKNNGTRSVPNIALYDSTYPKEDKILSFGFNVPQHIDVDGDGFIDMMVGCVFPNIDLDNFMFYKNIHTNALPLYSLQTKNFIPMIDAGSRSSVTGADYDGDGDIDLCVGSAGGVVNIYQNNGSKYQPVFSAQPTSTFSLSGDFYLVVTCAEMNGDGKPDLVIGTFDGTIKTFINTSEDGVISFTQNNHPVNAFSVSQNAAPIVVDVDNDGLIDVLVGNSGGEILFLKNNGTNINPVYQPTTSFNSIDVGNDAIPFAADIDDDGILELLIGNSSGTLSLFKKTSPAITKFDLVTKNFQNINLHTQSSPFMVDLDSDGDKDLLLGNGKGGVFFFENMTISKTKNDQEIIPSEISLSQNYPNPFNPSTTISFAIPYSAFVSLRIFDMLGRDIGSLLNNYLAFGEHSIVWNATNRSAGVYVYRLSVTTNEHQRTYSKTMSLIK